MRETYKKLREDIDKNLWIDTKSNNNLVIHLTNDSNINQPIIIKDEDIVRKLARELQLFVNRESFN